MKKLLPLFPIICFLFSGIEGVGQSKDNCKACPIYILNGDHLAGVIYADTTSWYTSPQASAYYQLFALGYDTVQVQYPFSVSDIQLTRKTIALPEVSVFSCYNTLKMGALQGRLQKRIGSSMAVLSQHVRLFEPDTSLPGSCLITKASVFMTKTDERQSSMLRLRMYSTQEDTLLPGNDLLHESVTVDVSNKGNWYTADIAELQIQLNEPVFVGWESLHIADSNQPVMGVIGEESPMVSYNWDVKYQFWRYVGHESLKKNKRKPNWAIQLELNCPCED